MHLFWVTVTMFFQEWLVGSLVGHEYTVAARSEVVAWHTADSGPMLKATST